MWTYLQGSSCPAKLPRCALPGYQAKTLSHRNTQASKNGHSRFSRSSTPKFQSGLDLPSRTTTLRPGSEAAPSRRETWPGEFQRREARGANLSGSRGRRGEFERARFQAEEDWCRCSGRTEDRQNWRRSMVRHPHNATGRCAPRCSLQILYVANPMNQGQGTDAQHQKLHMRFISGEPAAIAAFTQSHLLGQLLHSPVGS